MFLYWSYFSCNIFIIDYRDFVFSLLEHHRMLARFGEVQRDVTNSMQDLLQFLVGLYHGLRFTKTNTAGQPEESVKGPVSAFGGLLNQLCKDQSKFLRQMVESVGGTASVSLKPTFSSLWCPSSADIKEAVNACLSAPNANDMSWMQPDDNMQDDNVDLVHQLRRVSDFSDQRHLPVYRTERVEQMEFDAAVAASMQAHGHVDSVLQSSSDGARHSGSANENGETHTLMANNSMHEPTTSSAIMEYAAPPPSNKRDASLENSNHPNAPCEKHPRTAATSSSRFGSMDRISPIRHTGAGRHGSILPVLTPIEALEPCMVQTFDTL